MNENGLKKYTREMFGLAQKYQQMLMWSKDIHITIDTTTCGEEFFGTIYCHTYKDGQLAKTERFEINERDGFDGICAEMTEFIELILPYLP